MVYHGDPIYILYSYDQMWLVGIVNRFRTTQIHNNPFVQFFNLSITFKYKLLERIFFLLIPNKCKHNQPHLIYKYQIYKGSLS